MEHLTDFCFITNKSILNQNLVFFKSVENAVASTTTQYTDHRINKHIKQLIFQLYIGISQATDWIFQNQYGNQFLHK